jgi:uncharacterized membrane protein
MTVIWWAMAFFAVQASFEGLTYILGDLRAFDPIFREKYAAHLTLVRTHGVAGATALCVGLLAFLRWTRKERLHAWMGRLYGGAVLLAGTTAMPMALMAEGGVSSRLAFFLQATFWVGTLLMAVRAARCGRFALHRRFMVRNYALTYSAVASRLLLNGLQHSGQEFADIYPLLSWTWVMGLAMGEWWLWYSTRILRNEAPERSKKGERL